MILATSGLAIVGGVLVGWLVPEGPHVKRAGRFEVRRALAIFERASPHRPLLELRRCRTARWPTPHHSFGIDWNHANHPFSCKKAPARARGGRAMRPLCLLHGAIWIDRPSRW